MALALVPANAQRSVGFNANLVPTGYGRFQEQGGVNFEEGNVTNEADYAVDLPQYEEWAMGYIKESLSPDYSLPAYDAIELKPEDIGGLKEIFDLVNERAKTRFTGVYSFPALVRDSSGTYIGAALDLMCAKTGTEKFPLYECGVRAVLHASGVLNAEDFATKDPSLVYGFPEDAAFPEDALDYGSRQRLMLTLGVCHLIIAVSKPFVTEVTAAATEAAKRLCTDLNLRQEDLSATTHAEMYKRYFQRVDLRKLARATANRTFSGSAWLTAYARRYSAGTTHLAMIADFLRCFGDCPLWEYVPEHEKNNMVEAYDKVYEDPLLLFPTQDQDDIAPEKYRVAGMPCIVVLASMCLRAGRIGFWARYQNIPAITAFGPIPLAVFYQSLLLYLQVKLTQLDPVVVLLEGGGIMDKINDFSRLKAGAFRQTGGKKITSLAAAARAGPFLG